MRQIHLSPDSGQRGVGTGPVVVLGYFDGVHTAHHHLIELAADTARKTGSGVMVWTFSHIPKSGKGSLTTKEEKIGLLRGYGADSVVFESFARLRDLDGETFFRECIVNRLSPSAVVCGFNFRFGKGAAWGAEDLSSLSETYSVPCTVVDKFLLDGEIVSSTEIKRLLSSGDTEKANRMLGYEYSVTSPIQHGEMIGRSMGAPTVNQQIPRGKFRPSCGVYIVRNEFPGTGEIYEGVANLGYRPTVNGDRRKIRLESHLFGYSGSAYGSTVRTSFIKKIRDEIKFPDRESLAEQIRKDEETAAEYFMEHKNEKD